MTAETAKHYAALSELFMTDQLARNRISKVLPKGMELSHFGVLNHLARTQDERSPAQLARAFHVTRGAMTNTLNKLEWAGHVHIRPDWDDARRKFVAISPSGKSARDAAVQQHRRCGFLERLFRNIVLLRSGQLFAHIRPGLL